MARLPVPGQDEGVWGDVLNQYLLTAHTSTGGLRGAAVSSALPDGSVTEAKLDNAVKSKLNSTGGGDPAVGGDLSGTASNAQLVAGAVDTAALGDVVVRTLLPVGSGTYSQLSGSDGDSINNYQLVDERPFSATDFASSATVGNKDTYQIADLPAGVTTVYGMQLNGLMSKSDASLASARYVLRSGGVDYVGTTRVLTTTPTGYYELYENDPATSSSWTPIGINNVEAGMEVQ